MAKLSELTQVSATDTGDDIYVVQSGGSRRSKVGQFLSSAGLAPYFIQGGSGAVQRTWTSKARDFIDARDYGFSSSNSGAANLTALQDAATYMATLSRASLVMPAGLFDVTGQWSITANNMAIRGPGRGQCVLNQKTLSSPTVAVTGDRCALSGFSVTYDGTPTSGADAFSVSGDFVMLEDLWALASYRGYVFSTAHGVIADRLESTNHEEAGMLLSGVVGGRASNIVLNAGNTSRATLGNLRLVDQVEAIQFVNLEALVGLYSLTVDATVDSFGTRAAWNEFTNCIFDAAARGSTVNRMRGSTFSGCFFSGGRTGSGFHGIAFTNSKDILINGGQAVNSGKAGISISTGCSAVRLVAPAVHSNSVTAGSGANHGVEVAANINDVSVLYPSGGNEISGGQQGYDVSVAAGTSANVVIRTNSVGGVTGIVSHGGTGTGNIVELPGTIYSGALIPFANDVGALGVSGQAWADLFFATGGVINWNAGDVTITHSANTLAFGGASSGYTFDALVTITSANASAIAIGRQGATDPVLKVDASAGTVATGVAVTGAAAGSRASLAAISSDTNEGLSVDAKGSGTIRLGATSTGAVEFSRNAVPTASDGAALGTTALMWSDLFLATGAVLNFNNGNYTMTHAAGQLSVSGNFIVGSNLTVGGDLVKNVSNSQLAFYGGAAFDAGAGIVLYGESHATTPDEIWFTNNNFATRLKIIQDGTITVRPDTATPAAGSTAARLCFGTTAGFGIYYGSGAPTVSAGQGSIYMRSDGSSTSTRLYVNTNGGTTWTNVTTAA